MPDPTPTTPVADESIVRHDNGNIEVKLVIPWEKIDAGYKKEVEKAVTEAEVPGFRKGKAPRDMVEPRLNRTNLISKALGEIIPEVYAKKVSEHKLKPVIYPRIAITKSDEGSDWEFTATTCEVPTITLPDYKTELPGIKPEEGQSPIVAALSYLHKNSKVALPDLLVEEESDHRLSNLAENLTGLGLDIPKYLQTKKITAEELKAQTATQARQDLEIEFVISQIQLQEKLENREKTLDFLQGQIAKP